MDKLRERFMYYCGLLAGYMYLSNSNVDVDDFVDDMKHIQDLIDGEEQGTLIKLPCKVGDTVYWVCGPLISEVVVEGFRIERNTTFLMDYSGYPFGVMGWDAFLTKEEAEKKLAEIYTSKYTHEEN